MRNVNHTNEGSRKGRYDERHLIDTYKKKMKRTNKPGGKETM